MSKYLIVTASTGKNLEMAHKIASITETHDHDFSVIDLETYKLPLYSPREEENGIPKEAKELADKFIAADGFIFLAPEYNGSTPPLFNNSIAWISRSGDDWREAFNGKPTIVGTHSGGGGHQVLMHMQEQLTFLGCNVVGRKLLTSYSKELKEESVEAVLTQLFKIT